MIRETISIDDVVEYLNSVLEADPLALRALLCTFIPCSKKLAKHPTAIVSPEWWEGFTIGTMGLINGMFGISEDNYAAISYKIDTDTNRIIGFYRTDDEIKSEE